MSKENGSFAVAGNFLKKFMLICLRKSPSLPFFIPKFNLKSWVSPPFILKIFNSLFWFPPLQIFFQVSLHLLLKGEGTHNVNCRKLISTLKTWINVSDIEMYNWIPSLQVYHIKVSSYLGSLMSKILDLRVKNGSNFAYI